METESTPRPYPEWRNDAAGRDEDAAHTFGYHLMKHCRDEAIAALPTSMNEEDRLGAKEAIHIALHNVMDMLEGFWRLESGSAHTVEYRLHVVVKDSSEKVVETVDITKGIDLPIGFWGWAREGDFG